MTYPIHDAAQALRDAWDSPDRWSNPGYERVKKAETALRDALAARAQPTTDEVLYEAETEEDPMLRAGQSALPDWPVVNVPPGTRVRVVRATDQPSEDDLLDAERIEGTVLDAVHKVDGTCELVIEVPEAEYVDHLGTPVAVLPLVAADQPTEVAGDECAACAVTMPGRPCVVHGEVAGDGQP